MRFGEVGRSALDKHLRRLERDARQVAVDDGRKRHHAAFTVPDHGVHRRVLDERDVGGEVLAGWVAGVVLQQRATVVLVVLR